MYILLLCDCVLLLYSLHAHYVHNIRVRLIPYMYITNCAVLLFLICNQSESLYVHYYLFGVLLYSGGLERSTRQN